MTARDLTLEDREGFLKEYHQRQEETRFAQLESEQAQWTPASFLEELAILLSVTLIFGIGAFALGWAIYKALP